VKVTFKGKPLIPSIYLEAGDLQGKRVPVVIESVNERAKLKRDNEKEDSKPLFRLRGKEKGWVLNTTNLESIAEVYGYEAEKWIGKTVVIYGTKVRAFGETKLAIRVDIDATQARADAEKKGGAAQASEPPPGYEPPHDPATGEVSGEHDYGPPPMTDEELAQ
jgi:hypothetical protein